MFDPFVKGGIRSAIWGKDWVYTGDEMKDDSDRGDVADTFIYPFHSSRCNCADNDHGDIRRITELVSMYPGLSIVELPCPELSIDTYRATVKSVTIKVDPTKIDDGWDPICCQYTKGRGKLNRTAVLLRNLREEMDEIDRIRTLEARQKWNDHVTPKYVAKIVEQYVNGKSDTVRYYPWGAEKPHEIEVSVYIGLIKPILDSYGITVTADDADFVILGFPAP